MTARSLNLIRSWGEDMASNQPSGSRYSTAPGPAGGFGKAGTPPVDVTQAGPLGGRGAESPRRRRRSLALLVAVLLVAAFGMGVRALSHAMASAPIPGRPAPDFVLPRLDGPDVRLRDLRGRAVVLNFWASWCGPCREETPALEAFFRQHGDQVAFYAINVAEPPDVVRKFVDEFGVTYPVLLDRDRRVHRLYRLGGYPETFWIDEDGVLRVRWTGPMTLDDMRRLYQETTGRPLPEAKQPGSRTSPNGTGKGSG